MKNSKNIQVLSVIVIAAAIFGAGWLFFRPTVTNNRQPAVNLSVSEAIPTIPGDVNAQKLHILKRIAEAQPLTAVEKQSVFQAISGDKIREFDFSDAEKQKIIDALNR
jgi:hypothetical protein